MIHLIICTGNVYIYITTLTIDYRNLVFNYIRYILVFPFFLYSLQTHITCMCIYIYIYIHTHTYICVVVINGFYKKCALQLPCIY